MMIDALTQPFIPQLKNILPSSSWKWIIPALQRDAYVWNSLADYQNVFGIKHLSELIHKPEDCSPAYLALASIKYPQSSTELRTLPLIPVDSAFRKAVEEIEGKTVQSLQDAAFMALNLRQKRIETGSWNDWAELLSQSSPTAMTCLFGLIPDQLDLLQAILPAENTPDVPLAQQEHPYTLILHILLSNPIPPASQLELLKVIFKTLSPSQQQILYRRIGDEPLLREIINTSDLLPGMGTTPPQNPSAKTISYHDVSGDTAFPSASQSHIMNQDNGSTVSQLSIFSEQSDQQLHLLEQTIEKTYDLQAGMLAKMAVIAMVKGDIPAGIDKFNQARLLRPHSIPLTGAYFISLFHAPDFPNSLKENLEGLFNFPDKSSPLIKFLLELSRHHSPDLLLSHENNGELNQLALQSVKEITSAAASDIYLKDPEISFYLLVELASLSAQSGHWHVVELAMQSIVKQYNHNIPALLVLAFSMQMQGKHSSALNLLNYIECLVNPDNHFNQYLAQSYAANGRWREAYEKWQAVNSSSSQQETDSELALEIAAAAFHCGEFAAAQDICRGILKKFPDHGLALALFTEASPQLTPETQEEKFSQAIQCSPDQPYTWLAKYRFYRRNSDPQNALTTLKAASMTLPNSIEIQSALGDFYNEQGIPSLALPILQTAVNALKETLFIPNKITLNDFVISTTTFPSSLASLNLRFSMDWGNPIFTFDQMTIHLYAQLSQTLRKLGHLDAAQSLLETSLQSYPANSELSYPLAQVFLAREEYAIAGKLLKEVVLPVNPSVEARLDFVHCVDKVPALATSEEMINVLQQVIENDPHHFEALAVLAETLTKANEPQHALEIYEQILKFPQSEEKEWKDRIRIGMSRAALNAEQYELALATLLECDNQDAAILREQASIYLRLGLTDEALRCAQTSFEGYQQDAESLKWYASFMLEIASQTKDALKLHQNAVRALESAVELTPNRSDLRLALAEAYLKAEDVTKAHHAFQYFISSKENYFDPATAAADLIKAARYLVQLGDLQGAVVCYQRALDIESKASTANQSRLVEVFASLADIYTQQGHVEKAIDALEQALKISPADPALTLNLANAVFSLNNGVDSLLEQHHRLEKLIKVVELCRQNCPENGDIAILSAFLYRLKGERNHAIHILQSLLRSVEQNPELISQGRITEHHLAITYVNLYHLLNADLAVQLAQSYLDEGVEKLFSPSEIQPEIGFELLCEWFEENLVSNPNILPQIEKLIELSPANTRLQSIAVRLKINQGDRKSAALLFENALMPQNRFLNIGFERPFTPALEKISSWFFNIATMRSLAKSAQELGQWNIAVELINQMLKFLPTELIFHLDRLNLIVRRAEYQKVCEQLELRYHAPGNRATHDEVHRQFEESLEFLRENLNDVPTDKVQLAQELEQLEFRADRLFPQRTPKDDLHKFSDLNPVLVANHLSWLQANTLHQDLLESALTFQNDPFVMFQVALGVSHTQPERALKITEELIEMNLTGEALDKYRRSTWLVHPETFRIFIDVLQAFLCWILNQSSSEKNETAILDAVNAVQSALEEFPYEPRWYVLASNLSLLLSEQPQSFQQAISFLEQACQLESDNINNHLKLSSLYLQAEQYDSALESLEKANQLEPDNPKIIHNIALAHYKSGRYEEAANYADIAIQLQPLQEESLILRGEIALAMKDTSTALQYAEQALEQPTNDPSAWSLLARALDQAGKTEDALRVYEQAIPINPMVIPLQIEKISLIKKIYGLDSAITEIKNLMREVPDSIELTLIYTEALLEKGNLDEAIVSAQAGLRSCHQSGNDVSNRHHARCHGLLGELMNAKGHLDQAIYHLSEAAQLDPDEARIQITLGDAYYNRGELEKALVCYLRATQLSPTDPAAFLKAGSLSKELKDYSNAEHLLRQAARLDPENLAVQRQLGAVVALNLLHNRKKTEVEPI